MSYELKRGKKKADPELIEKVTKALHLLESLTFTKLEFIFKGGTALLLLLDDIHRFSIDIDIIIEGNKHEASIDPALEEVINNSSVFERFEEQARNTNEEIPKAHYKVFYTSVLDGTEKYILLDILFEKNHYSEIIDKEINCTFIDYNEPAQYVQMPSIDCILGDKLTAFAPNTTGIPYGKNKELEIIKQMFDVGNLFDSMNNINVVNETFKSMAQQELNYRGMDKDHTYVDVLDDIFNTSRILSARGGIERETYELLENGVKTIKDYIFSRNFIVEAAVNSAAKAAYLSLLLKHDIKQVERFDSRLDLQALKITSPDFKKFKSIIKFDPEAYFYWYKCIEIINPK
ncbi:nucleotidyl transferase AbiEii/AbiGii toxin family protein [Alkalicoccus urumqiensis]|nr:nucleotidyl transferase AbiEii/AbiGii toxin family protein [Alkalicoccus urumqiensis]